MTIDLTQLDLKELMDLQKQVEQELPRRAAAEKLRVLDDLKKLAIQHGFDLQELLGVIAKPGQKKRGSTGPVAAKYRSKDGKEWSGRGRKPQWVNDHLAGGGAIEDLAV
ncbi:MAG: H-NS histone family protein [Burkholderiales bacterium]|nr:H-NS histone family protein [Burkholderiales bacterium]